MVCASEAGEQLPPVEQMAANIAAQRIVKALSLNSEFRFSISGKS